MKINAINTYNFNTISLIKKNIELNQTKNVDIKSLYPFNYTNNISFGAKTNAEKLKYIGEENFPNQLILDRYKETFQNGDDKRLYQIHAEYYADLLNCETLEDAKALYSEFSNVIDAKEITQDLPQQSSFYKVLRGEIDGLSIDNLSLKLLQSHYGQGAGINAKEKNYGFLGSTIRTLFSLLNIKELDKKYMMTMHRETPEYAAIVSQSSLASWQNPEFRQGRSEDAKKRWQRDDYRQGHIAAIKEKWQDPEYRQQASERWRRMQETTDLKERQRAAMHKMWSEPESRAKAVAQIQAAGRKRWEMEGSKERWSAFMKEQWQDPEYREKIVSGMSERMKKVWQKPEYIELKRRAMAEKWEDPEFREYVTTVNIEKWKDPEYRARVQVYIDALKLAWEMHPEIRQMMSEVAEEYPGHGKLLTKVQSGQPLTNEEQRLFNGYYKKCHEKMPHYTWIVGQTQKQIIAMWKEQGIIPNED